MKFGLYVIYDSIADESSTVFQAKNDAVATRMICNQLADIPSPDDFKLLHIGFIDTDGQATLSQHKAVEVSYDKALETYKKQRTKTLNIDTEPRIDDLETSEGNPVTAPKPEVIK